MEYQLQQVNNPLLKLSYNKYKQFKKKPQITHQSKSTKIPSSNQHKIKQITHIIMKQSTIAQKLNLQQLITNLKMLSEQVDQSQEQMFQPFNIDEMSLSQGQCQYQYSRSRSRIANVSAVGGLSDNTIDIRLDNTSHYHATHPFNHNWDIKEPSINYSILGSPNRHAQTSSNITINSHFLKNIDHTSKNNSNINNLITQQDILNSYCRKKTQSKYSCQCQSELQIENEGVEEQRDTVLERLKKVNCKLFDDNKVLIKQCIRLRRLLNCPTPTPTPNPNPRPNSPNSLLLQSQSYQSVPMIELQSPIIPKVELQNLQFLNQINKLQVENLELKLMASSFMNSSIRSDTGGTLESPSSCVRLGKEIVNVVQKIKKTIIQLSDKLQHLMAQPQPQTPPKLSHSNTTTHSTLNSERDRIISSIKVIYEDKIKLLESQILMQKEEIMRLKMNKCVSGPGDIYGSRPLADGDAIRKGDGTKGLVTGGNGGVKDLVFGRVKSVNHFKAY